MNFYIDTSEGTTSWERKYFLGIFERFFEIKVLPLPSIILSKSSFVLQYLGFLMILGAMEMELLMHECFAPSFSQLQAQLICLRLFKPVAVRSCLREWL